MSPPPRPLSFVVSTSLLSASLSLAACDDKGPAVNPGPEKPEPKHTINEGPVEGPQPTTANPEPQPPTTANPEPPPDPGPEPIHVNEGPEPPPPPDTKVNPGPETPPPEPLPSAIEPKRVNTRPDSEIPKSG